MNEFSKEIIEINNQEYTLFLNRKGIIAWEKFCKDESKKAEELKTKYDKIIDNPSVEINDETNPFDGLEEIDNFDEDKQLISTMFKRLYWIMLYTEHKFTIVQASKLYDMACEEYGETNIIALGQQMMEDANKDMVTNKNELKNLSALRPQKK